MSDEYVRDLDLAFIDAIKFISMIARNLEKMERLKEDFNNSGTFPRDADFIDEIRVRMNKASDENNHYIVKLSGIASRLDVIYRHKLYRYEVTSVDYNHGSIKSPRGEMGYNLDQYVHKNPTRLHKYLKTLKDE